MKSNENIPDDLPRFGRRSLALIGGALALALVVLFIAGFWPRHERIAERETMAAEIRDQPLVVQVVRPESTAEPVELSLPADIRAYAATALYARTNGYLASSKVDIGDRVRAGDLMALISAPDSDANLEQAEANLRQEKTSHELAAATYRRYEGLIPTRGVTQQQLDQFRSAEEQAQANVVSSAAAVDRLRTLVNFERITAPFDGVVTARNYDAGALISAANIGPGQELFDLAEDDWLRVFVNIPQAYAPLLRLDSPVTLVLDQNYPDHVFMGRVKRSAGALDPVTRTLRTELDFRNGDPAHRILPGMYGRADLSMPRNHPILTIPTSALLFEADGKQVAVVDGDNRVHFRKIAPGSDFGTRIEVLTGLKGDEWIVSNPGEQLGEGIAVSPVAEGGSAALPSPSSDK